MTTINKCPKVRANSCFSDSVGRVFHKMNGGPVRKPIAKTNGFTLIELMVAMLVLGVILAIAVPMFNDMVASARIAAERDELNGSLVYARSEAIKQGLNVIVCPSTTVGNAAPTCANQTAWATGWLVIATTGNCDSTTGVFLRQKNAFSSTDIATYAPRVAGRNNICFNRFGLANGDNTGLFVLTRSDGVLTKRCLSLTTTGVGQALNAGQSDASGVLCQ